MMQQALRMANEFSGPILFDYVWWILTEAQKRGIKKLYFLARDGYTLQRIAQQFCQKFNLNISCEYLYCSRTALRMPSYFFIGDEAFDLLLMRGYHITLKSVLQRISLNEEERNAIYAECGIQAQDEERRLSKSEFEQYTSKIRASDIFRNFVVTKSKAAYQNAVGYFKAQGLFEQKLVAIVDSGWTGSIQRSLRQLLEFAGYQGELLGFYFGMFARPKTACDGTYLTWYFNWSGRTADKILFCNNLFECLLSAPHGMTTGYCTSQDGYQPILSHHADTESNAVIVAQSDAICQYAQQRLANILFADFDPQRLYRETRKRIIRYMTTPSEEEAAYYGTFYFCDDITEAYHSSLASAEQQAKISGYSIFGRVLRRLLPSLQQEATEELFWPYGVLAFLPPWKRRWYKLNIYAWEFLKYTAHRSRGPVEKRKTLSDYQALVRSHSVISFDVFDTLLYRTVNYPTDVFRLVEPMALQSLGINHFYEKRIQAEKTARKQINGDEVTFSEIYTAMNLSPQDTQALMQYELDAERFVLRRDPLMAELLHYCIEHEKRVLLLSDMYQSSDFLEQTLQKAGIHGYFALYVSSQEKATKASGQLFLRVANKEKILDKTSWLHIGDNLHSDHIIPQTIGLHTEIYDNGRYNIARKNSLLLLCYKRCKARVKQFLSAKS